MRVTIQLFDLAPYQRAFLYNPHRFTGVEASTKAGKTAAGIQWAVEQWHDTRFNVGWETTWCSPVYEQSKIAFKRIKRALPTAYDVNSSSMTMYTPRGDELRFKSADNVDNLYGPDARAVVFEEYTRAKSLLDAFMALRSTLTATRGKMKLIGNYIGESNAGHQLLLSHKEDPEWAHFIVTAQMAVDAGILDADELAQARKDLPLWKFMALYMCQGSAHPLQMIRADAINDIWTNEGVPKTGRGYITADIARFGRDRTVAGVWHGMRLIAIHTMATNTVPEAARFLRDLATAHKVGMSDVVVDEGGVGGGVVDLLPGCVSFNGAAAQVKVGKDANYGNLRSQCYYRLADVVNGGGMYIETQDYREEIAVELEVVRRMEDMAEGKLKVIKKDEMKELIGMSPDFADMMMMRMVKELQPSTTGFERAMDGKSKRFAHQEQRQRIMDTFGHLAPDSI